MTQQTKKTKKPKKKAETKKGSKKVGLFSKKKEFKRTEMMEVPEEETEEPEENNALKEIEEQLKEKEKELAEKTKELNALKLQESNGENEEDTEEPEEESGEKGEEETESKIVIVNELPVHPVTGETITKETLRNADDTFQNVEFVTSAEAMAEILEYIRSQKK